MLRVNLVDEILGMDIAEMGVAHPKQLAEIDLQVMRRESLRGSNAGLHILPENYVFGQENTIKVSPT